MKLASLNTDDIVKQTTETRIFSKRQGHGNKKAADGKPAAKSLPQLDSSSLSLVKLEW